MKLNRHNRLPLARVGKRLGIYVLDMPKHVEFRALTDGRWLGNWFRSSGELLSVYHREKQKGLTPSTALGMLGALIRAKADKVLAYEHDRGL